MKKWRVTQDFLFVFFFFKVEILNSRRKSIKFIKKYELVQVYLRFTTISLQQCGVVLVTGSWLVSEASWAADWLVVLSEVIDAHKSL